MNVAPAAGPVNPAKQMSELANRLKVVTEQCQYLAVDVTNWPELEPGLQKLAHLVMATELALEQIKSQAKTELAKIKVIAAIMIDINIEMKTINQKELREAVAGLDKVIKEALVVRNPDWREHCCRWIKVAFEQVLTIMLEHKGINLNGHSNFDKVMTLKKYFRPLSRFNCFFELNDTVNPPPHAEALVIADIEEMMVSFRRVLKEVNIFLSQPITSATTVQTKPAVPVPTAASSSNKPYRYKTLICRNWSKYGECRQGDECSYAHGSGELRKV